MATTSATSTSTLDVNSIVSQLMSVERQPITKLAAKEAGYQAKLSAYGSVKSAVSTFQTALQGLNSAAKFNALSATASDTTVFSASATSSAVAGTYSLEVTSLAQAQKLVATGQSSSTDAIGAGASTTLTFDFGTISGGSFDSGTGKYTGASFTSNGSGVKTVTIDSSNNSLQGIRDAINAADIGVTATLINDGGASPYRLVLSSANNGVSNSMKLSVSGDATLSSLLAHDPAGTQNLSQTVTAQNANFKLNGVSVSKTSNTVSDVLEGVTLTLNKVTTSAVSLTVAKDTASVKSAISGFVKAYNDVATTLKSLSAYDASTKKGAVLQGDATVRSLQTQLRGILSTAITGTSGDLTTLSDAGVTFQTNGSLALDQTKLDKVIASNFGDIASLFAAVGKTSDSLVSFKSSTSSTQAGSYAVSVSQLATQGKTVGVGAITVPLTITGSSNDTLTLSVNDTSATVTLAAGTYNTVAALVAELQTKINGASALTSAGISVVVSENAGVLTITSSNYGSTSKVSITGGTAETDLGLNGDTPTDGVNVAGTIGGVTATGEGQVLSLASGDATGLSLTISGGTTGNRGTVYYSEGYAAKLNTWATSILASDGLLSARTDGINKTIADIGKRREALETRMVLIEKRYRAQFVALDQSLSSMNATSTYLTQQLAQIANM